MAGRNLTTKANEAIALALRLAATKENPNLEPVHILTALLVDETTVIGPLLEALGTTKPDVGAAVDARIAQLPSASGSTVSQPTASCATSRNWSAWVAASSTAFARTWSTNAPSCVGRRVGWSSNMCSSLPTQSDRNRLSTKGNPAQSLAAQLNQQLRDLRQATRETSTRARRRKAARRRGTASARPPPIISRP